MQLKKSQRDHIEKLGPKWDIALAATTLAARRDPHLVGLNKIREPLAIQAALRATGCVDQPDGFVLPPASGKATSDILDITAACFESAVELAKLKLEAIEERTAG